MPDSLKTRLKRYNLYTNTKNDILTCVKFTHKEYLYESCFITE